MRRAAEPTCRSRGRVRRVSSAATTPTDCSTSLARALRSPRLPRGVATTNRVAGRGGWLTRGLRRKGDTPAGPCHLAGGGVGRGGRDGLEVLLDLLVERRLRHGPDHRVHVAPV